MENRLAAELIKIVGKENVLVTPEDLAVYSYDGTFQEARPEVVVLPATTPQISQIVKLAAATRTPIVPRGMGSGLAAGSVPLPAGGMVLSLTRMNHILEIDEQNATVHAEAGVVTAELQAAVEKGWALAWWCGSDECERKVKDDTKATTRCIPLEQSGGEGKCIVCGNTASEKVIFGKAY